MVFSPAKLSSWRPRAEAGRTGEHREHSPARGRGSTARSLGEQQEPALAFLLPLWQQWEGTFSTPQRGRNCCGAERSGGFPSIRGPEKSSVVTLQHQKGWIVLPVVKCQAPARSDQQEFGAAVKQRELDSTAELSFSESNPATLRLPTKNNGGNQTAKSS